MMTDEQKTGYLSSAANWERVSSFCFVMKGSDG